MNLKQLEYFIVVAQERQITSAAKRLYIAQPPLSYQLKQLEKELHTKLFKRTAYGIELTTEGEAFKKYAEKMITLSKEMKAEILHSDNDHSGVIRLGLISSAGNLIPNKAFSQLTRFYPEIKFELFEGNTFSIIEKLDNDLIDVAIVRTPFNMRGLKNKILNTDEMVAVFDSESFDFKNSSIKIQDLANKPLILYRRFEALFNESFSHQGMFPFYAVKCDDARTAILWADRGMGIALVPESIAKTYSTKSIQAIDHLSWSSHIELVWKKDKKPKPVVQRLIDSLSDF
ncbi:LysR family transcriptional regulator [uncultured Lactobacillus sp.]|uniref:LysR family transcriptional regulator n=1 Tax=uncultured Lactobacillus sp. TaxID=153152 RepID=UPI00260891F8|nr:LysR family transcriptional regulator [uncultured Lactobacillus sp.]